MPEPMPLPTAERRARPRSRPTRRVRRAAAGPSRRRGPRMLGTRDPDPAEPVHDRRRPGRTAACRRRRRSPKTSAVCAAREPDDSAHRGTQDDPARRARPPMNMTPMPRVEQRAPVLAEHPRATDAPARAARRPPRGAAVRSGASSDEQRRAEPGRRPPTANAARDAPARDDERADERADEQADPVDAAERRQGPGPHARPARRR